MPERSAKRRWRAAAGLAELLAADIGWGNICHRLDDTLAQAPERGGYRGLKSIIADRRILSEITRGLDRLAEQPP